MTRGQSSPAGVAWRKSSSCTGNATCVEVAQLPDGGFAMRDGKDPGKPHLAFGASPWAEFLAAVRAGEFHPSTGGR
jgi:hypothetical protein